MEKIHSDHLIKERGFVACEFEGRLLKCGHLDFYESKLYGRSVKIMGYIVSTISTRVILDTRKEKEIPFDYIYCYADQMRSNVSARIWKNEILRRKAAQAIIDAKAERLSVIGTKVHVRPRYYLNQHFPAGNGVVVSSEHGEAVIQMDRGFRITVETTQLNDWEDPDGYRKQTLLAERGALLVMIDRVMKERPFGPDRRAEQKAGMESNLARIEKELTSLGVPLN
jgi:hypothetical protein